MNDLPLSALFLALAFLLLFSGFFSGSETVMMAANRYRLKHAAEHGHRGAQLALDLLAKTDKLLGMILLGNTLFNAGSATVAGVICIRLMGTEEWVLGASTLLVTFAMLVFAEITPKVIGASYADRLAPILGYLLTPVLKATYPVVWFVNLFVRALLGALRLKADTAHVQGMSAEELRILVLEAGHFIPQKHRSILMNLFDLEHITIEDVMIPRGAMEMLDLQAPMEEVRHKLATSYHTRLPVFEGDPDRVEGMLHMRRVLGAAVSGELDREALREALVEAYFVPASTPVLAQLQYFQENRQRIALAVDEYGEIVGLVTLEDILEEIIGKFTTGMPGSGPHLAWEPEDNSLLVDGGRSLRELNRLLGLSLPLSGPKTLNGLILEHFQDIPEAGVSVKIADVPMEVVHTQDRMVKTVRLFRPR
ncbi:MAG: CNNM domain-containing protein [Rhodocyclaceae bacterium]|nr:CNNM domain-containing protein [Rhodocyclaceae bacterium]